MPEAVKSFIETNSYIDAGLVQNDILDSYTEDMSKYASNTEAENLFGICAYFYVKINSQYKEEGVFMIYGYVRVSSKEQNKGRKVVAMKICGVEDENIFIDKQSGKDFNRVNFKKLMRKLHKDDTSVIKSIDKSIGSYSEIIEQRRIITHKKKKGLEFGRRKIYGDYIDIYLRVKINIDKRSCRSNRSQLKRLLSNYS